jgi:hypothetical protein
MQLRRIAPRAVVAMGLVGVALFVVSDVSADEGAIALTLATGANIHELQARVTAVEHKAIAKEPLSDDDKAFLHDLYAAMAMGAKRSGVLAQSRRMMERYLDGSGTPLELTPAIFRDNARVRAQLVRLKVQMAAAREDGRPFRSPRFYMPDASQLDSVTGLYWGTVTGSVRVSKDGDKLAHFRAEVPWEWPSYESLQKRYGTPHAETFELPNIRSLIAGPAYALHIENGLGEYLVRVGLAKPFVAWSEWDEPLDTSGLRDARLHADGGASHARDR